MAASAQGQLIILNESAVELFINAVEGICILAPPGSVSSVHIFSDHSVESAFIRALLPRLPFDLEAAASVHGIYLALQSFRIQGWFCRHLPSSLFTLVCLLLSRTRAEKLKS